MTDPLQARLLTDPRSKPYFAPFLARECSAAQAARELACPLNTLLYRVRLFLRAGLLQVTRVERRPGRPVKLYRSAHDAYFVPFSLTSYATLEERLTAQAAPIFQNLIRAYAAALEQGGRLGQYLLRSEAGAVWTTDRPPELTALGLPVLYTDTLVRLNAETARTLAAGLRRLFEEALEGQAGPGAPGDVYVLLLACLPFPVE